jgi:hypothetical protein
MCSLCRTFEVLESESFGKEVSRVANLADMNAWNLAVTALETASLQGLSRRCGVVRGKTRSNGHMLLILRHSVEDRDG